MVVAAAVASNCDVMDPISEAKRSSTGAERRPGGGPAAFTTARKARSRRTISVAMSVRGVIVELWQKALTLGRGHALGYHYAFWHLARLADHCRKEGVNRAYWCGRKTEATSHQANSTQSDTLNRHRAEFGPQVGRKHG